MSDEQTILDQKVRYQVYDAVMRSGQIPAITELASMLSQPADTIKASLERLGAAHILVLQKETNEILMANPFSAIPTPFLVKAGQRAYYGNCIWDAMGIPAMLKQDATIEASCGCCGSAKILEIKQGRIEKDDWLAHFAIPAVRWWDDIVFN